MMKKIILFSIYFYAIFIAAFHYICFIVIFNLNLNIYFYFSLKIMQNPTKKKKACQNLIIFNYIIIKLKIRRSFRIHYDY